MIRRTHLASPAAWMSCIFCVFTVPGLLTDHLAQAAERPNILFIAIDDLNDWIGCLGGHPQVQTPHMDRLAARGTLFTNAHCQSPLCNPSRTSVLTGLRPSTTGVYALQPWIRTVDGYADYVSLPEHFKMNGYKTMMCGKIWHGGFPPPKDRSREWDLFGPPAGVGVRPEQKIVTTNMGNHPLVDWGTFPHRDEDKGDWKLATWTSERLTEEHEKPFFLAVGFFLPHVPCYATQKWFDLYPENSTQLPEILESDRADTPEFSWYLHWKLPEVRLSWLRENNQWLPLVRAYLASTSFVDSQVGRVLDALEQSKYADNTIVVLWSDHGWHLGEKAISGKNTLWAESTRIPLIFAGPGITSGVKCTRPAELLDLYPTLIDLCDLPEREGLQGHSLAPQLKDPLAPRQWPAITTHNMGNHSVVTETHRYIHYADGSEELYDIVHDPHEFANILASDEGRKVAGELKKWLPEPSARPAPGSKDRLLENVNGVWMWEHEPVVPSEKIE